MCVGKLEVLWEATPRSVLLCSFDRASGFSNDSNPVTERNHEILVSVSRSHKINKIRSDIFDSLSVSGFHVQESKGDQGSDSGRSADKTHGEWPTWQEHGRFTTHTGPFLLDYCTARPLLQRLHILRRRTGTSQMHALHSFPFSEASVRLRCGDLQGALQSRGTSRQRRRSSVTADHRENVKAIWELQKGNDA